MDKLTRIYTLNTNNKVFSYNNKEIEAKTFPWTTFTSVLQCAMQNKELIKNSVFQKENRSDEMWQQISDMAAVLAPLLKAYDLLIDKSSVISSMILPVHRKLEMELTSQTEDSEFSKVLKRATWLSISEPFHSTTVRNFLFVVRSPLQGITIRRSARNVACKRNDWYHSNRDVS